MMTSSAFNDKSNKTASTSLKHNQAENITAETCTTTDRLRHWWVYLWVWVWVLSMVLSVF